MIVMRACLSDGTSPTLDCQPAFMKKYNQTFAEKKTEAQEVFKYN
jgi:hypothetical protein